MDVNPLRDIKHDLYEAAMDGIPTPCRYQRCGKAYLEALALSVAAESAMESALLDPGMPLITAERVSREVFIRIGVYCASECSGMGADKR